MRTLVLTPGAFDDLSVATRWYEEKRSGLGATFEQAIDAVLMRLQRVPLSFPAFEEGFRRAVVKRFPYDIYFSNDDQRVLVVLVIHTARDPKAILERLRQH